MIVTDGTVVATDAQGRPAIVVKRHEGGGHGVLCTYPLEHFAARSRGVNPEDTWRLYRALATLADVEVPVRVDDPRVLVDGLRHADGREFWFLASEHPDAVDVSLEGRDLTTLDGREASHLHLEPWGVQVVVRHNEENR